MRYFIQVIGFDGHVESTMDRITNPKRLVRKYLRQGFGVVVFDNVLKKHVVDKPHRYERRVLPSGHPVRNYNHL